MADAPFGPTSLAVLVPTFRRPNSLLTTLEGLRRQEGVASFAVVVADNDQPANEGGDSALAWAREVGWGERLSVVPVAERGLSSCRNAGLARAFANSAVDAVAMIDDDAIPEPGWLAAIGTALALHRPALIGGPTAYWFEGDVPATVRNAELFAIPDFHDGVVPRLRSSNNCTITRSLRERWGDSIFSTDFSFSGGEDTELFVRCAKAGLKQVWASAAVVREKVPEARATEAWVLKRHRLSAANAARIDRRGRGLAVAMVRQSTLAAKELVGGVFRVASSNPGRRFVGRMRLAGVAGRFEGLADIALDLYRG